jgi:hypothetical protein
VLRFSFIVAFGWLTRCRRAWGCHLSLVSVRRKLSQQPLRAWDSRTLHTRLRILSVRAITMMQTTMMVMMATGMMVMVMVMVMATTVEVLKSLQRCNKNHLLTRVTRRRGHMGGWGVPTRVTRLRGHMGGWGVVCPRESHDVGAIWVAGVSSAHESHTT